jgi:hypothetical protein
MWGRLAACGGLVTRLKQDLTSKIEAASYVAHALLRAASTLVSPLRSVKIMVI